MGDHFSARRSLGAGLPDRIALELLPTPATPWAQLPLVLKILIEGCVPGPAPCASLLKGTGAGRFCLCIVFPGYEAPSCPASLPVTYGGGDRQCNRLRERGQKK